MNPIPITPRRGNSAQAARIGRFDNLLLIGIFPRARARRAATFDHERDPVTLG
jgi:hypothetical protein